MTENLVVAPRVHSGMQCFLGFFQAYADRLEQELWCRFR